LPPVGAQWKAWRVSADPVAKPAAQTRAKKRGSRPIESGCGRETDCLLEGDGFELPVPRKLGLRRGRRLALHLGSLNAPAARPRLERDQAAPGFGEEGEHCRRVIKRRATASKARPELGALLGLKAVRFGASNAVL
jgi:hypothetical protein